MGNWPAWHDFSCWLNTNKQKKKISLKSDFILFFFFFMVLYMYIGPRQGQTAPRGKSFDVNGDVLTLHSFVASFKKSLWSRILYIFFFMILYICKNTIREHFIPVIVIKIVIFCTIKYMGILCLDVGRYLITCLPDLWFVFNFFHCYSYLSHFWLAFLWQRYPHMLMCWISCQWKSDLDYFFML